MFSLVRVVVHAVLKNSFNFPLWKIICASILPFEKCICARNAISELLEK